MALGDKRNGSVFATAAQRRDAAEYRLLAEQEIRCIKVGRAYKIPKVCVIEYLMGEDMCRINLS